MEYFGELETVHNECVCVCVCVCTYVFERERESSKYKVYDLDSRINNLDMHPLQCIVKDQWELKL